MNTRLYLDTRASKQDSASPLKYVITKNQKAAFISLPVKLMRCDWDKDSMTLKKSCSNYKSVKATIERLKSQYDDAVMAVAKRSMTAIEIRDAVLQYIDPSNSSDLLERFSSFAESRKATHTKELYLQTYNKLCTYVRTRKKKESLSFEEIDKQWLKDFDEWMQENGCESLNTRGIHLRNLRAVFNDALDDEIITNYPFRKFQIKKAPQRHRALDVEVLRKLINYKLEGRRAEYRDMFMLSFLLIGINAADILGKRAKDVIVAGRYEYKRQKTGRFYSIKIEPEAQELLDKYKGTHGMLLNVLRDGEDINDYNGRLDIGLQHIGVWTMHPKAHRLVCTEPLCNKLTWYWARHTWATIARSLDVPKDIISQALGHSITNVTDTYIQYDIKKVDEANRKVIDYVFYSKE